MGTGRDFLHHNPRARYFAFEEAPQGKRKNAQVNPSPLCQFSEPKVRISLDPPSLLWHWRAWWFSCRCFALRWELRCPLLRQSGQPESCALELTTRVVKRMYEACTAAAKHHGLETLKWWSFRPLRATASPDASLAAEQTQEFYNIVHAQCSSSVFQRAPNVHQQTCTSRWAENSKEWKFFSAARHAPTLHVFNVGPNWVFSFAKTVREKIVFLYFPWKLPHFREREKVAETLRQCTFSFDNLFFLILVRVIAQEAPKTLKWPSGCAQPHLLVHIRRPPSLPELVQSKEALTESLSRFLWRFG